MKFLENELSKRGLTLETATPEEIANAREMLKHRLEKMGYSPEAEMPMGSSFTCCICGKHYNKALPNSAYPVAEGDCCPVCNELVVSQARLLQGENKSAFIKSAYLMMPGLRRVGFEKGYIK